MVLSNTEILLLYDSFILGSFLFFSILLFFLLLMLSLVERAHSSVSRMGTVVSSFFPHPLPTPCCVQKMQKMFPQAQGSVSALCDICNMGTMILVPHGT